MAVRTEQKRAATKCRRSRKPGNTRNTNVTNLRHLGRQQPAEKSAGANNAAKNTMAEQAMAPDGAGDEGVPAPLNLYVPGSLFARYTQKTQHSTEMEARGISALGGGLRETTPSGRPGTGTGDQTQRRALEGLTSTETECAEGACTKDGAPCSSKPVLVAIAAFSQHVSGSMEGSGPGPKSAPTPETARENGRQDGDKNRPGAHGPLPGGTAPEAAAVRKAAAAVGCGSESCLLAHPRFVNYAEEEFGLEPKRLQREKDLRFKAAGPRLGHALLNNFNIDETLQRWARVFTSFFPYPFAMMDFDRTGEPFATIDPVAVLAGEIPINLGPGLEETRRPCQTLGCVVNTDVSTGKGKHWVAVFVDCRGPGGWTVEYFNSAGRPPPKAMTNWMERTRARLATARKSGKTDGAVTAVAVTDVAHQESQTECGLYALFYIRRRLEGTPAAYFEDPTKIITDDEMTEFRKHCFRAAT